MENTSNFPTTGRGIHTWMETWQASDNELIVFRHHECRGMVGESHYWSTARCVNVETGQINEMSYDDLNRIYNSIEGKKERMAFFYMKRPMSPKAIKEEGNRSREEAISYVM